MLRQIQKKSQEDAASREAQEHEAEAQAEADAMADAKQQEEELRGKIFGTMPTIALSYYPTSTSFPPTTHPTNLKLDLQQEDVASKVKSLIAAIAHSRTQRQPGHIITLPVSWENTHCNIILRSGSPPTNTPLGKVYEEYVSTIQPTDSNYELFLSWRKEKNISDFSGKLLQKTTKSAARITKDLHVVDYILDDNPTVNAKKIDCNPLKLMKYEKMVASLPQGSPVPFKHFAESNNHKLCKALENQLQKSTPERKGDDVVLEITPSPQHPKKWYALLSRSGMNKGHTELMDLINKNEMSYNIQFKNNLRDLLKHRGEEKQLKLKSQISQESLSLWKDPLIISGHFITKNGKIESHTIPNLKDLPTHLSNIKYVNISDPRISSALSTGPHLVGFFKGDKHLPLILAVPKTSLTLFHLPTIISEKFKHSLELSFVGAYILWKSKNNISSYEFTKNRDHLSSFEEALSYPWYMSYKSGKLICTRDFNTISATSVSGSIYSVTTGRSHNFWEVFDWGEVSLRKLSTGTSVYACLTGSSNQQTHNAVLLKASSSPGFFRVSQVEEQDSVFKEFIMIVLKNLSPDKKQSFTVLYDNIMNKTIHVDESHQGEEEASENIEDDEAGGKMPGHDEEPDDEPLEKLCQHLGCKEDETLSFCKQRTTKVLTTEETELFDRHPYHQCERTAQARGFVAHVKRIFQTT